jgi:hypothetical protein
MRGDWERQGEDVVGKSLIQAVISVFSQCFHRSFPRKRESIFALGPRFRGDERNAGLPPRNDEIDNRVPERNHSSIMRGADPANISF